jgi:hypothetical protein
VTTIQVDGSRRSERRPRLGGAELMELFQDLPPMSAQQFWTDVDGIADAEAYFDAYERAGQSAKDE